MLPRGGLRSLLAVALLSVVPSVRGDVFVPAWTHHLQTGWTAQSYVFDQRLLADDTLVSVLDSHDSGSLLVVRTDLTGNVLGSCTIPFRWFYLDATVAAIDGAGDVFVTAHLAMANPIGLMKFDGRTGAPLWPAPFVDDAVFFYGSPCLRLDPDGDVYLASPGASPDGMRVYRIAGATGLPVWGPATFADVPTLDPMITELTADGALLVTALRWDAAGDPVGAAIVKLSTQTGARVLGPILPDLFYWVQSAPDGGVFLAKTVGNGADQDVVITRLDVTGAESWSRQIPVAGTDTPYRMAIDAAGACYVLAQGETSHWAAKLTPGGTLAWGPVSTNVDRFPFDLSFTREGHLVILATSSQGEMRLTEIDGATGALRWGPTVLGSYGIVRPIEDTFPILTGRAGDLIVSGTTGTTSAFFRVSEADGSVLAGPVALPSTLAWGWATALDVRPDGTSAVLLGGVADVGTYLSPMALMLLEQTGVVRWGPIPLDPSSGLVSFVRFDSAGNVVWLEYENGLTVAGKKDGATGAPVWGTVGVAAGYPASLVAASGGDFLVLTQNGTLTRISGADGHSIFQVPSGDLAIAPDGSGGSATLSSAGAVRRHDGNGALLWGPVTLSGSSPSEASIAFDGGGNVIAGGLSNSGGSVWKLAAVDGGQIWRADLPAPGEQFAATSTWVLPSTSGDVFFVATYIRERRGSIAVRKLSSSTGAVVLSWEWTEETGVTSGVTGASLDSNGNLVLLAEIVPVLPVAAILTFDGNTGALVGPPLRYSSRGRALPQDFALRGSKLVICGTDGQPGGAFVVAFHTGLGLGTLPDGVSPALCGASYSFTFTAANGTPPYGFALVSGSLPPGPLLDASTGAVTGTPTTAGTYPFRLEVTDSNGRSADADYSIVVAPGADVAILAAPTSCGATTLSVAGSWASVLWVPTNETTSSITADPPYAAPWGVVVTEGDGCIHRGSVVVSPDLVPPVVTPPVAITIDQSLCCGTNGGASGAKSAALAAFLAAGSATDCAEPTRLAPQVGGWDVTPTSCFAAGTTAVAFRFRDAAQNVGAATSNVTVRLFGDLNADGIVDPTDFVIFRAFMNFVVAPGTPPFNVPLGMADLTHDGTIDPSDLIVLRGYFNLVVGCLAP